MWAAGVYNMRISLKDLCFFENHNTSISAHTEVYPLLIPKYLMCGIAISKAQTTKSKGTTRSTFKCLCLTQHNVMRLSSSCASPKVHALTCYDTTTYRRNSWYKALKKVQKFAYPLPIEMLGKVCSRHI